MNTLKPFPKVFISRSIPDYLSNSVQPPFINLPLQSSDDREVEEHHYYFNEDGLGRDE